MYLAELSSESQRAFLNLAIALISADGKISQDEIVVLNMYKAEISLMSDISDYNANNTDSDIECIAKLDATTRKKIYFELVSLAYTDSDYSDEEKLLIKNITEKWQLDAEICKQIDSIAYNIIVSLGKLGELING